jgi:hypothetical protein
MTDIDLELSRNTSDDPNFRSKSLQAPDLKRKLTQLYTKIWTEIASILNKDEQERVLTAIAKQGTPAVSIGSPIIMYYLYPPYTSLMNDVAMKDNWVTKKLDDGRLIEKSPNEYIYQIQMDNLTKLTIKQNAINIKQEVLDNIEKFEELITETAEPIEDQEQSTSTEPVEEPEEEYYSENEEIPGPIDEEEYLKEETKSETEETK